MRSNSKRTILLLTDGRSNRGTPPGQVATQLHSQMGVDIYALGIGGNVDVVELQSITKQKNPVNLLYLLLFNGFEEFFEIEKIIKDDLDQSGLQCKAAKKIYDKKKWLLETRTEMASHCVPLSIVHYFYAVPLSRFDGLVPWHTLL